MVIVAVKLEGASPLHLCEHPNQAEIGNTVIWSEIFKRTTQHPEN